MMYGMGSGAAGDEPIRAPPESEASDPSEPIRGPLEPGSAPGTSSPSSGLDFGAPLPTRGAPRLSRLLSGKTDPITVSLDSDQLTKDPEFGLYLSSVPLDIHR